MIPQRLDDITAAWLTSTLQPAAPGVHISDVVIEIARDATNFNGTLRVAHDAGDVLPERMFVKLPPIDLERRSRLDWASMGRRECRFYRDLAPRLDIRIPAVLAVELDDVSGEFCLLMECLDEPPTSLPDLVAGVTPDLVATGLASLAGLHVRFEDPRERKSFAPWLSPAGRSSEYGARLLRAGIENDPATFLSMRSLSMRAYRPASGSSIGD